MKKVEIIVPDRLFNDANGIIKDTHADGMAFFFRWKEEQK